MPHVIILLLLCRIVQANREKALAFVDSISMNMDSNDPHEHIERNIREQINIITDNVTDLQKLCAQLDEVCLCRLACLVR